MSEVRYLAATVIVCVAVMLALVWLGERRNAEYYGAIDVGRFAARAARTVVEGMP